MKTTINQTKKDKSKMGRFTITKEDMLRSKVVTPGWYRLKIKSSEDGHAKTDQSLKTTVDFTIVGGPFEGVPVSKTFSEKAPGFVVPFIEAYTGTKMNEDGGTFDLSTVQAGREVEGRIATGMYNNRPTNNVEDFRAVS